MGLHLGWGSKLGREGSGSYQDVCPICRELRRITVYSYFTTRYVSVQFIPIPTGGKEHALYVAQCGKCGGRWIPSQFESLRRESRGAAEQRLAGRLQLEEKAKSGTLSAEERAALVYEPLHRMAEMTALRLSIHETDRMTMWGVLVMIVGVLTVFATLITQSFTQAKPKVEHPVVIGALLLLWPAFFFSLGAHFTRYARFVRREIYPRLARSLKPIRPSLTEVEAAVERLCAADRKIGKRFKAARLFEQIELS